MSTWNLALASIALSVAAQFSMKAGMSGIAFRQASAPGAPGLPALWSAALTDVHVLLGFACYGLSALVWLRVLSAWEVSKAYPLVGLGFALSVAVGFAAGEAVTWQRVLGVALICLGAWWTAHS